MQKVFSEWITREKTIDLLSRRLHDWLATLPNPVMCITADEIDTGNLVYFLEEILTDPPPRGGPRIIRQLP